MLERDPLSEKPPRGWRAALRWIWRCARWPWWDPPAASVWTAPVSGMYEITFKSEEG